MSHETCSSCRFMRVDNDLPRCHRQPPVGTTGWWPLVTTQDWCGEYQPKHNKPAADRQVQVLFVGGALDGRKQYVSAATKEYEGYSIHMFSDRNRIYRIGIPTGDEKPPQTRIRDLIAVTILKGYQQ